MEHGVYICSWSRSPDGYTLWVKSRPHLRKSAQTYPEAEERLIRAIHDAGGAVQAVLEFDPPLPKSELEAMYCSPEICLICGDDRFETDAPRWKYSESFREVDERLRWSDAFYTRPVCRKCKFTSGMRNDKPVTLTYAPSKFDGAFGQLGTDGGPIHQLVSEEFLALLTPAERDRLRFQPTIRKRGRKFLELVGPEGPPLVAVAGLKISGWRCGECGHRTWDYWVDGLGITSFVAQSDMPNESNGLFTVGTYPEIMLAVTAARWSELRGRKGARGLTSSALGVVSANEVITRPDLPTYEDRLRE